MSSHRHRACVVAIVLSAACPAQAVLDQEFDPRPSISLSSGVTDRVDKAQTFAVGISGKLERVEVFLSRCAPQPGGALLFDVRRVQPSGVPIESNSAVLAALAVPASTVSRSRGFFSVNLSSLNISVNQGDALAIALRNRPNQAQCFSWWGRGNPGYPNGKHYFRNLSLPVPRWAESGDSDVGFRIYIEPRGTTCGPAVAYAPGFPGAYGVPALNSVGGLPRVGNATFALRIDNARENRLAAFVLGFSTASFPLGMGRIAVAPDTVLLTMTTPLRSALLPIPVPALQGLVVRAQAAIADPLATGGVALTPAVAFRICPRPRGDYGDAPDGTNAGYSGSASGVVGKFPTLYASPNVRVAGRHGIVHVNPDPDLRLGATITMESVPALVDLDADDAAPMLGILNGSVAQLRVDVRAKGTAATQIVRGFVNVLADLNRDGAWDSRGGGGAPLVGEWVVRNHPIAIPRGQEDRIELPVFRFGSLSARTDFWTRITITPAPIDAGVFQNVGGWDGSGPAAGYPDGETEDVLFPCEGGLLITYPFTDDRWGQRLRNLGNAPGAISVQNLANQPVVYVFKAKTDVAHQLSPSGWRFLPVVNEFTMSLTAVPNAGFPQYPRVVPAVANLPPQGVQVAMALNANGLVGDTVSFDIRATVNRLAAPVVDDTTHPTGHWDNILGRLRFYPIGPCIAQYQQVGTHPIYFDWP